VDVIFARTRVVVRHSAAIRITSVPRVALPAQGRILLHHELLLTTLRPSLCQIRSGRSRHRSQAVGGLSTLRDTIQLVGNGALLRYHKHAKPGAPKSPEIEDNWKV
jgi:hypothetical protein